MRHNLSVFKVFPFFVFDNKYAVSGATCRNFVKTLEKYGKKANSIRSYGIDTTDGDSCGINGCD
jgi:hypothetical protein